MIRDKNIQLKIYHLIVLVVAIGFTACSTAHKETITIQKPTPKIYERKNNPVIQPETYVCQFVNSEIIVDGKPSESSWQKAKWTNKFVDIEGSVKPLPTYDTRVKMLWDSSYFYFYAQMDEPHVWAKLKNRDDIIYYDDDFEIFIDPDGDSHNYYELEWNAFNTLWDLILLRPYRVDDEPKVLFNWNVLDLKSAVHVEGTINNPEDVDKYWGIEIALPWSALKELAKEENIPDNGNQWRLNFSRVDWTVDVNNNEYVKRKDKDGESLPENNWVWSPTGKINMHMPEMWGHVQFSINPVGTSEIFQFSEDEEIKNTLWNLYWQQLAIYKKNNSYSINTNDFNIPQYVSCRPEINFYKSPFSFEISSASCDNKLVWIINHKGKIYSRNLAN
jgi:hypothetical protein